MGCGNKKVPILKVIGRFEPQPWQRLSIKLIGNRASAFQTCSWRNETYSKQPVLQQHSALMTDEQNAACGFVSRRLLFALLARGLADTEK